MGGILLNTVCLAKGGKKKGPPGTVADNREAKFNFEVSVCAHFHVYEILST